MLDGFNEIVDSYFYFFRQSRHLNSSNYSHFTSKGKAFREMKKDVGMTTAQKSKETRRMESLFYISSQQSLHIRRVEDGLEVVDVEGKGKGVITSRKRKSSANTEESVSLQNMQNLGRRNNSRKCMGVARGGSGGSVEPPKFFYDPSARAYIATN